jgi:hypothetical protein
MNDPHGFSCEDLFLNTAFFMPVTAFQNALFGQTGGNQPINRGLPLIISAL